MQRHIVGKVSVSAFLLLMVSDNIIHCDINYGKNRANLHLFQRRFVIGWENNRDGNNNAPIPENNR